MRPEPPSIWHWRSVLTPANIAVSPASTRLTQGIATISTGKEVPGGTDHSATQKRSRNGSSDGGGEKRSIRNAGRSAAGCNIPSSVGNSSSVRSAEIFNMNRPGFAGGYLCGLYRMVELIDADSDALDEMASGLGQLNAACMTLEQEDA